MRWLTPVVMTFLLWALVAGVWLHDWRVISGALVAFVGVILVEESVTSSSRGRA